MATSGSGPGDFEALARQYWQAWGESMRRSGMQHGGLSAPAMSPAGMGASAMPGWQDAVDWWSRLAQGGSPQADDVVQRFNAQARDWFGAMQQVAAQFSGHDAGAADIAASWKQALGALGDNPFPDMFKALRGQGAQGLDQWVEAATPYLESMRREGASWLGMPAFGIGREQQERRQALLQAQLDYQQRDAAYNALMFKALQQAHELFADKLSAHEEPGRQLTSARALFDLWIDAAEEAYAAIALSPEFRKTYGALVNAQMRLRQGVQREVEQAAGMLGMPTRTEVDAAHRKIAELERAMRRMRDAAGAGSVGRTPKASKAKADSTPVAKKTAKKRVVKKAATRKAPAKAARKPAARKAVAKKPATGKSKSSRPTAGKRKR